MMVTSASMGVPSSSNTSSSLFKASFPTPVKIGSVFSSMVRCGAAATSLVSSAVVKFRFSAPSLKHDLHAAASAFSFFVAIKILAVSIA